MRPTLSELRGWATQSIIDAADKISTDATTVGDSVSGAVVVLDRATWRGDSRAGATQAITGLADKGNQLRNTLLRIADETADAGADLHGWRERILTFVTEIQADGYVVSDTGTVTHPDEAKKFGAAWHTQELHRGLNALDETDERYGTVLETLNKTVHELATGDELVTVRGGGQVSPTDVVTMLKGMETGRRRDFFLSLSASDRERVIAADPRTIAGLDGIDYTSRFTASEINIRTDIVQLHRQGNHKRANVLSDMLTQADNPSAEASPPTTMGNDPDGERKFLYTEDKGNGHLIEMVGDLTPDTRNVTVYVPGTGTKLESMDSNVKAARNLAKATGGPVFVYLDGDLPQKLGYEGLGKAGMNTLTSGLKWGPGGAALAAKNGLDESLKDSAADPRFAKEMAPGLVTFGKSLDAEIDAVAPGAKTTYIGHSYGGSVVGTAEQLGLRADRVIYASSAGTGVYDTGWKNPNHDVERYSMTAPGDPIHYSQELPMNPHGADPDSTKGVTRLDTGYYGPDENGQQRRVEGARGHGEYWNDPQSDAFKNMVKVIRGEQPTEYVERDSDYQAAAKAEDILVPATGILSPMLSALADGLDRDINLPGPLPDIELKLP
ncbi:pimeloyl-ACP methyl ester carboxylesterase [Gordonia amarae]|uniref:DUF1023 domain-containing protein n=2 Tax=Gordonia amarae TaxID=36821 RepID=G7GPH2_9ACTN|nr:alpha/beta hydrolase [Gordonia amarae]MCS3879023.1 pimeloyl-ACP methyl ester carboxylesterase [Gordonia amarae]GAB05497.1 hypothetical protein GOAMR_38_00110 [Gordonia amarae NBRC 15530]